MGFLINLAAIVVFKLGSPNKILPIALSLELEAIHLPSLSNKLSPSFKFKMAFLIAASGKQVELI